jgi:predicted Zn-dependent protease
MAVFAKIASDFSALRRLSMRFRSWLSGCALTLLLATPAAADYALPDIGTAGVQGLTVERERQIGEYFLRQARGALPVAGDPVMNEYLTSIGSRLVMAARDVRFPFTFLVVVNPELNAAAFLGGVVQVNTGLFHYAENEDEFASVIAHEISHVTQRHIARFIEDQSQKTTLTTAGLIGAVAMSIINPTVGLAALSTTMGVSAQTRISFTRENEAEADRAGIDLLARAGFNPMAMADMFEILLAKQGNINPMYAMLIDHPLSGVRVSEARSRAAQLGRRRNSVNPNYDFARARADVRYMGVRDLNAMKRSLLGNPYGRSANYLNYALALICYEQDSTAEALSYLDKLKGQQDNIFVLDLRTDIDLKNGRAKEAAARLQEPYRRSPDNEALALNLANALKESGQTASAIKILKRFTERHPENVTALSLLSECYSAQRDRCNAMVTTGELNALKAAYPEALGAFDRALSSCTGQYSRDIVRALVSQVSEQRRFDDAIKEQMR